MYQEKKTNPWWVTALTIAKYVITAILGALGGAAVVNV